MIVRELIEMLQKMPVYCDVSTYEAEIDTVRVVEVIAHDTESVNAPKYPYVYVSALG